MKAVILAGGLGKRLRPLTDDLPKPLIEVAGKPIIEWQIEWFKKFNVYDFIILAGYKKEILIDWVTKNQNRLGINAVFSTESEPLGTGGAIKKIKNLSTGDFFVVNGDVLTNIDLTKLLQEGHNIALVPLRSTYGVIKHNNGLITEFVEKPILYDYWMNSGVYKFNEEIFDYLPDKGDIERTAFPQLAREGKLKGVKFSDSYWISIDSFKDIEKASEEIKKYF